MAKWQFDDDPDNPNKNRVPSDSDPNLLMNINPSMWPTADVTNTKGPNKGYNPMSMFLFNNSAGSGGLPFVKPPVAPAAAAAGPAAAGPGTASITGTVSDAAASGAAGAGATSSRLALLKYLFPTAASAIEGFLDQRNQTQANNQRVALTESLSDPFRQNMDQAKDLGRLDMMANANVSPTKLTPPPAYAAMAPGVSGGPSYTPSAALRLAALATQKKVASGQGAPTMTDPSNYGKTSTLDLESLGWGK